MQFSPKNLGLNVGIFGTVSDSPGLDFQDCFRTVRKWVLGTVLGSLDPNFWYCFRQSQN